MCGRTAPKDQTHITTRQIKRVCGAHKQEGSLHPRTGGKWRRGRLIVSGRSQGPTSGPLDRSGPGFFLLVRLDGLVLCKRQDGGVPKHLGPVFTGHTHTHTAQSASGRGVFCQFPWCLCVCFSSSSVREREASSRGKQARLAPVRTSAL